MSTSKRPARPDVPLSPAPTWADRAAEQSQAVRRSRARTIEQAHVMVRAAQRLIVVKGSSFTTQELAKEAGVALQTFYRHFPSKDHLLLATLEEAIHQRAIQVAELVRDEPDPVARLRFYIVTALRSVRGEEAAPGRQFILAEHWRLYRLFPEEMEQASRPYVDLIERDLREAADAGLLHPHDPAAAAWLAMNLVRAVFHHLAFAPHVDSETITEQLWTFCSIAFGGPAPDK